MHAQDFRVKQGSSVAGFAKSTYSGVKPLSTCRQGVSSCTGVDNSTQLLVACCEQI